MVFRELVLNLFFNKSNKITTEERGISSLSVQVKCINPLGALLLMLEKMQQCKPGDEALKQAAQVLKECEQNVVNITQQNKAVNPVSTTTPGQTF